MNGIECPMVGNLTRDPELRYTTGGRGVVSTGIAVSRRYQQDGEWKEQTTFVDLVIWGVLGENVAASLAKGSRVVVVGRLEQRSWETESGETRSKYECIVEAIGPDLRFATATVTKIDRTTPDREPSRSAAPQYTGDEEPF